MSFNIRYANPYDGPNSWENRKVFVPKIIRNYESDFVGIQEALFPQIGDLQSQLPLYSWVGRTRDEAPDQGEASPILYLHEKWEIGKCGTFWLSETPEKPGSMTYGNKLPRVCTWAQFTNKKSKEVVYLYNCHLDHENHYSQKRSAEQIKDHIEKNCGESRNVFFMGDCNCTSDTECLKILRNQGYPLQDTCTLGPKEPKGTYHYWTGSDVIQIDHILVPEYYKIKKYQIVREKENKRYPSDHFPIYVELEVTK